MCGARSPFPQALALNCVAKEKMEKGGSPPTWSQNFVTRHGGGILILLRSECWGLASLSPCDVVKSLYVRQLVILATSATAAVEHRPASLDEHYIAQGLFGGPPGAIAWVSALSTPLHTV